MYNRKLTYSFCISIVIGLAAVLADIFVDGYLFRRPYTPASTFCIGFVLGLPPVYYFISQRLEMQKARRELLQVQAARESLLAQLKSALDETEAANAAKSDFLATMSHELRTPLNGVLGMVQAMAADELIPAQRNRLDIIKDSGTILLEILNDVLDLSKIEAGKLDLEEIEFDLYSIFGGVAATFTTISEKKGINISFKLSEGEGRYRGDPTRLRQVLYNLVSNAVKFTDCGEVGVVARRSSDRLTIIVEDTGIGMSDATISNLFARFNQAETSTARRFGGTGLGLSICLKLSQLMGGDIHVTSAEGRGSRFEVNLPLRYLGPPEKPLPERATPVSPTRCKSLRVLAAEDNQTNRLVLATLLNQFGVEPKFAETGVEALEAWRQDPFDLILMDVHMPHMDGLTATREIRRLEALHGRPRTPVIALTADVMSHNIKTYRDAGMDGIVAKPIQVGDLYAALSIADPANAEEKGAPQRRGKGSI